MSYEFQITRRVEFFETDLAGIINTEDDIPLKVISGISYRPTPKWNFEFNADYTDWRSQDHLTIQQAGPQGQSIFVPLQWE